MNREQVKNGELREMWRWVDGYEGLYMVSNKGNIKRVGKARGAKVGRILKLAHSGGGYPQVGLTKNCEKKIFRVHRLVAKAFLEPVEGKPFVNHKDGNKTNNVVDNLEWCTRSENALHSYRVLGNKVPPRSFEAKTKKLSKETIRQIYESSGSYASIARKFGISDVMVRNIKIGKSWRDVTCQSTAQ